MATLAGKIDSDTELRRLASVLLRKVNELDYLAELDGETLMLLRLKIQDAQLKQFRRLFETLAAAGKLIPKKLSARFCSKIFGPELTANMSYYADPKMSAAMCKYFSADFLTDISRVQIPERAQALLENLPIEVMQVVLKGLLKSRDYYVMGGFTDYLPIDKVLILMQEIKDPRDCLRVSSYSQKKERITEIALQLSDDELLKLVATGAGDDDLRAEIVKISANVEEADEPRLRKIFFQLKKEQQFALMKTAKELGIFEQAREFVSKRD